ncbi:MAG TPA: ChaN family lipoprotein [Thermodesulfobacteriota bacterium]
MTRTGRTRGAGRGAAIVAVAALAAAMGCATHDRAPAGERVAVGPDGASADPTSPYRDPASLAVGEILHGRTGRLVSESELLDYLAALRVVYVGETHDSPQDHAVQLAVLRGLAARAPGRLVLGLEMLRRSDQAKADAFVRGEIDEAAFREVWAESWGEWEPYAGIVRFAREAGIRLLALNAEADLVRAVRRHGVDGLPPELAGRLPEMRLDDPYHRAYLQAVFAAHGPGSARFDRFYEVQVLWDETMADTAARALERGGDRVQLVVLAGGGHVRFGFGIPRRLFRRLPAPYAIVLPVHVQVSDAKRGRRMDATLPEVPLPAGDFYWAVRYE